MDKYIKQKKGTKRNNKKIPKLVTELQKQPPEVFCKKRCSEKFGKIHRKTLVPETLLK